MNSKNTLLLATLAAGLFAFIYFFERHLGAPPVQAASAPELLPTFEPGAVSRVEILVGEEALRVELINRQWRLTAPISYRANPQAIESFLQACRRVQRDSTISARDLLSQPRGIADYGLEPPRATLVFQQRSEAIHVRLGSNTPVGDQLYVQVAGDENVHVVEASFLNQLPHSPNDWRDRSLMHLAAVPYNRLEVRASGRGFEVQREAANSPWRLTRPPPAKRADSPKIDSLIQQLQSWQVHAFVTDNPAVNLEPFGLQPPEAELAFGQGTNDLLVVQFGKSPTNAPDLVFARRLSHTNIVLVPRNLLNTLQLPFSEFRDRRLAFFSPEAVDQIEVRGEQSFSIRRQPDGSWRILEPHNLPADSELVADLLARLGQLEIAEFVKDVVTDYTSYGLANPAQQFTLFTGAAAGSPRILAQIGFGARYETDKMFARRGDENSVYAVPLGEGQRLPSAVFELRDRRIWNFSPPQVQEIVINADGQMRKLVRNTAGEWAFAPGSQGVLNIFSLEETLFRLGQMRVEAWVGQGEEKLPRYGITDEGHKIALVFGNPENPEIVTLEFGRLSPSRRPYAAAILGGQLIIFEFPLPLYQDVMRDLSLPPPVARE